MRRLLLAGALAVAVHGYLLGREPDWLKRRPLDRPNPPVITMTLTHLLPPAPEPKPLASPPIIPLKKSAGVPKMETPRPEEPKPVPRPIPIKKAKKESRKMPKPKKKDARRPEKRARPKEKATEPEPRPIMASFQPKKEIQTKPAPDIPVLSKSGPVSEPRGPEVTERPSDPLFEIPDDVLAETRSAKRTNMASLPPVEPIRQARPAYMKNPRPEYPGLARRRGYQGTTILEVLVGRTGRVMGIRVLKSSGYRILDDAAVDSVKTWLFEPGTKGDEKVEMWVRVPMRFELK